MKLILFIEKITLDCRNYAFNITEFAKGDENHFGAFYTIEYNGNPAYRFKINKDGKGSIVIMIGSSSMMDKLIFANNDIVYPMAFRMEEVPKARSCRSASQRRCCQVCLRISPAQRLQEARTLREREDLCI